MASTTPQERQPDWVRDEFAANAGNGRVGSRLVSETETLRVWHIHLGPGERLPVHRHVLSYFWSAITPGRARSHHHDGTTVEVEYQAGDTRHLTFGPGESMMHDLENIGDTELVFATVEFKTSGNPPLPV
jgi:mannose-6-phosphate isomerase-like protein (cupin superfamily)